MPTSTGYRQLPGEMAHGIAICVVLAVIHWLFGKRIDALIEAVAMRLDREVHIHAELPAINATLQHAAIEPMPEPQRATGTMDDVAPGTPEWYNAVTHHGDGEPAFQPIDPTDADWPDPDPTANEHRTALIEPGVDLLAQIRAMPNPPGVPFPNLTSELED